MYNGLPWIKGDGFDIHEIDLANRWLVFILLHSTCVNNNFNHCRILAWMIIIIFNVTIFTLTLILDHFYYYLGPILKIIWRTTRIGKKNIQNWEFIKQKNTKHKIMQPFTQSSMMKACAIAMLMAIRGVKRNSLTPSGAVAAWVVGFASISCGLRGFLLLLFYMVSSFWYWIFEKGRVFFMSVIIIFNQ